LISIGRLSAFLVKGLRFRFSGRHGIVDVSLQPGNQLILVDSILSVIRLAIRYFAADPVDGCYRKKSARRVNV
jgi:hypothetical protein